MYVHVFPYSGHLSKGTAPPAYLLDGLKQIRYSLYSWIRTKEVQLRVSVSVVGYSTS